MHLPISSIQEVVCVSWTFLKSPFSISFNNISREDSTSIQLRKRTVAGRSGLANGILSGTDHATISNVLMMDVLPLSIGIQKADDTMEIPETEHDHPTVSQILYTTFEDDRKDFPFASSTKENIQNVCKRIRCFVTFCCRHKAGAKPVNFLHP
jgi:hypothetical protein